MGRQRITNTKKVLSPQQKKNRLATQIKEWNSEFTVDFCFSAFIVAQLTKGNSKATISFYKRSYRKFSEFLAEFFKADPKVVSIQLLENDLTQPVYMEWLGKQGLNVQTVNSYLRGLRSFGNFCEEEGYIDSFRCPIKEVEPPVKQVYTDEELERLMVKPAITDFAAFRTYCIISLILNTGARANTIMNIRICDLEIDEGYINFNTTKTGKVVRLGLERKTRRDLTEWLNYWRLDKGAEETDFLFCNEYGEQMCRSTLSKSFRIYNNSRGVEKTSIHLLRHTFAKKWITSGGDIITLARVLTHSELEMVKRYANLYGTDVKKEIEEHSAIAQMKTKSGKTLRTKKKLTDK